MSSQAQQHLDEIQSTLATLTKMVRDIEPSLCGELDLARLRVTSTYLTYAEDMLADICADNNEAQEDEDSKFPFEAWDMMAQQPVTVLGFAPLFPDCYRIEPGRIASISSITTDFPHWYRRAQQARSDEADQRDTEDAVRYG